MANCGTCEHFVGRPPRPVLSEEFNPDRGLDPGWRLIAGHADQLRVLATPAEVADFLHTTTASLAQDRLRGTGPKFIKRAVGCSTRGPTSWNG
jgi:hypothetical protein